MHPSISCAGDLAKYPDAQLLHLYRSAYLYCAWEQSKDSLTQLGEELAARGYKTDIRSVCDLLASLRQGR